MDGNKDEAVKCLNIAKEAIKSGDNVRSRKFLEKARRLDPSIDIDDLLSNLGSSEQTNERNSDHNDQIPSNSSHTHSKTRHRVSASSTTSSAAYTEEQMDLIRQIKRKTDYYEILGLDKNCSGEDIPRAYRKLSLKVHPDKNSAPGAEEAFKKVSKAFKCLSDSETRKRYDLVGSDEPETRQGRGSYASQGFNGFYEGDIDADEVFRNFFFGGGMHTAGFSFGQGPGIRVRTGGGGGGSQGSNWRRALIQLVPVILIMLMNFMPSSEPIYSLSASYSYDYRFTTEKGVNFYVKSAQFEHKYPTGSPERVALEHRIHDDYHSVLLQNCRVEWQQLHWGYRKDTPNCDALKRFEALHLV